MSVAAEKEKKEYWYYTYIWDCLLCGRTDTNRERRYTPKPDDPSERYDYQEGACDDHFM